MAYRIGYARKHMADNWWPYTTRKLAEPPIPFYESACITFDEQDDVSEEDLIKNMALMRLQEQLVHRYVQLGIRLCSPRAVGRIRTLKKSYITTKIFLQRAIELKEANRK